MKGQAGLVERSVGIAHRVEARRLRVARRPLPAGIDLVELVGQRGGEGIQLVLEAAEHVVARVDEPLQLAGSRLQGSIGAFDLERGDRNPAIGGMGHVDLLRGALVDQVVAAVVDGNATRPVGC